MEGLPVGSFDGSMTGLTVGAFDGVLAFRSKLSRWESNPGPRSSVKNDGTSDCIMERTSVFAFDGSMEGLPVGTFDCVLVLQLMRYR